MSTVPDSDESQFGVVASGMDTVSLGLPKDLSLTESFDDFYRRTYAGLLVLARALVGSAAEDVAQESMLVAYRNWGQVAAMASPVGWVRRVCLNKAVSTLRRTSLERKLLRRSVAGATDLGGADDVASVEYFWSLVRQLPGRQAQAVALRYAADLSVVEVAEAMGCAEGTVKAHLARAKASLSERVVHGTGTGHE